MSVRPQFSGHEAFALRAGWPKKTYDRLVEALDANADIGDPAERLARARDGLRLLLYAWARYEDETQGRQREKLQDIRNGWGVMAREFMRSSDDDE